MKKILFAVGLFFSVTAAQAQGKAVEPAVTTTLQNHYNNLKTNSNNYRESRREYKVIEVGQLNAFWNNVLETVRAKERNLAKEGKATVDELEQAKATIADQSKQIAALKKDNALKAQAVEQSAYEVDNIFILGVGLNKQFFLVFSFGMILGLIVLAAVIMSLYKKSKVVTDEKIRAFRDIDNEFNEFKKSARERELKIKRELQTEMNSKEDLKQQLASLQKVSH